MFEKLLAKYLEYNPNSHLANLLEEKEVRRTNTRVPIGNTSPNFDGMNVCLDLKEAARISVIAPTRVGKTTLMASILFMAMRNNFLPVILFDPKFVKSDISDYKEKLLWAGKFFSNEEEIKNKLTTYIPLWVKEENKQKMLERNIKGESFQFDLDDLDVQSAHVIFNTEESYAQMTAMENLFSGRKLMTIESLFDIISNKEQCKKYMDENVRRCLKWKIRSILGKKLLGNEKGKLPLRNIFKNKMILDIAYPNSEALSEHFLQATINITAKMIERAKSKYFRSLNLIEAIDEVRWLMPKKKSRGLPGKEQLAHSVQYSGFKKVNLLFGIQDTRKVDDIILSQSNYFLITGKTHGNDVKKLLENISLEDKEEWKIKELLPRMELDTKRYGIRPWLLIERGATARKFFPFYYNWETNIKGLE